MAQPTVLNQAEAANNVRIPRIDIKYEPLVLIGHYFLTENEVPVGRLSVNVMGSSLRSSGAFVQKGSQMSLSFFAELEPGISDARLTEVIAFGRSVIVYAFDQLTTNDGHRLWGRG